MALKSLRGVHILTHIIPRSMYLAWLWRLYIYCLLLCNVPICSLMQVWMNTNFLEDLLMNLSRCLYDILSNLSNTFGLMTTMRIYIYIQVGLYTNPVVHLYYGILSNLSFTIDIMWPRMTVIYLYIYKHINVCIRITKCDTIWELYCWGIYICLIWYV